MLSIAKVTILKFLSIFTFIIRMSEVITFQADIIMRTLIIFMRTVRIAQTG